MIFLKISSPAAWNFSSLPNIVLMFLEDPLKMLYVNRMEIKHLDTYMRLLKDICANKKSTSVADRRYDKEVPLIRGINILIKRWCWKLNEEREEWKQKI